MSQVAPLSSLGTAVKGHVSARASRWMGAGSLGLAACVMWAGLAMAQPSGQATPTQAAPPEAAAPAQSTPASPAATSPQAAAKPKRLGDRVICKEETILGTRLKTLKTCRTANEWRRIQRGFQAEMKTFTDRGAAASINGN